MSHHRQQRRNSRYTQSTGYTSNSGYPSNASSGYISESYRSGYTDPDTSFRSDPSYRSEYEEPYDDDGYEESSQYSSRRQSNYQDVGSASRGYTSQYYDNSTIQSSQHKSTRRESDVVSQHSVQSTGSRSTAALNSGYSTTHSVSNTTVADGGRGRCPYQIEFTVTQTGKQMSSSKRIISFRFGFANRSALEKGKAGVECRGEEHEVVANWSVTGGKRSIHVDGREIHYQSGKRGDGSVNPSRRADVLEAKFRMQDHICELICYAYKPSLGEKKSKSWRQYNLIIDGRTFFDLPQIFDLGIKGLGMVNMTREMPPMIIEANDESSLSEGLIAPSIRMGNEVNLKRDVQSRIQAQRNILKCRQKSSESSSSSNRSRVSMARAGDTSVSSESFWSRHSNHSDISNLTDRAGSLNVSDTSDRNIFSNAPSELDEARRRQEQQFQQQTNELQNVQSNSHQFQHAVAGHIVQEPQSVMLNPAPQHYTQQQQQQQPHQQGLVMQQSSLHMTNQNLIYPPQQHPEPNMLASQQATNPYQTHAQTNGNMTAQQNHAIILSSSSVPISTQHFMTQGGSALPLTERGGVPQNGLVHQQPNVIGNDMAPSQLSLASSQTAQRVVNISQQSQQLQLNDTQNKLMSQRPPSMADIRASMTDTGHGSNQSSSNEFGYY